LHNQRTIFDCHISAIEINYDEGEEPEVCIFAEDKLMDLRMTRRMFTYEQMSDADIAADIAEKHSLSSSVDVTGPTYDRIQQMNMSDLAFLRDRARLLQADVWIENGTLNFKTRDKRNGPALTLVRGNDIITVTACADLAHQRTSVRVSGYDANNREVIDEEATQDAVQAEIISGRSGSQILQTAFNARVSHRVCEVPLDASEATDWARAEMLRRARHFVKVNGVTSGHPDLIVGTQLTLERMGPVFDGDGYYVTRARHSYDLSNGHRTQFEAERAAVGNFQ
jgi:phage protein D